MKSAREAASVPEAPPSRSLPKTNVYKEGYASMKGFAALQACSSKYLFLFSAKDTYPPSPVHMLYQPRPHQKPSLKGKVSRRDGRVSSPPPPKASLRRGRTAVPRAAGEYSLKPYPPSPRIKALPYTLPSLHRIPLSPFCMLIRPPRISMHPRILSGLLFWCINIGFSPFIH